jgi:hemoglobin-like flavoprotein
MMKLVSHPLATDLHLPRVGIDRALAQRLRSSFQALVPVADQFAEKFYMRLFEVEPSLRSLFPSDMTAQRGKLLTMLAWIISNLENGDELKNGLSELGQRHQKYNARPEHYPIVAGVMIGAMAEMAGEVWDQGIESDWRTALERIAAIMLGQHSA